MLSPRQSLAILALVAGTIVAVEVLFTRLLSVVTWYSLAFVVLSMAMLGLTSGSLQALRSQQAGTSLATFVSRALVLMGFGLALATTIANQTPMNFTLHFESFVGVVIVSAAIAVPMIAGGAIVARLMAESPVPVPKLYAIDLTAAAAGAMLPLLLLGPLSATGALLLLSAVLVLSAALITSGPDRLGPLVAGALLVLLLGLTETGHGITSRYVKGVERDPGAQKSFEAWNPISHVEVGAFRTLEEPILWGGSPVTPRAKYRAAMAVIDGEAGTPVYAFERLDEMKVLEFDVTAQVHELRPKGTACIIGVGGGRDLLAALLYPHDRVIGAEINPSFPRMLQKLEATIPLLREPRVEIIVGDGREVFSRLQGRCSVLQASLVDTWAATGAGAFAHTESTLYTREAWAGFLNELEPDGVLTFSRWYSPANDYETGRLVALAMAALLDRHVAHPRDHLAMLTAPARYFPAGVATLFVSPSPFTPADLATLHRLEEEKKFTLLLSPDRQVQNPLLAKLLEDSTFEELSNEGYAYGLDTRPTTDERPFFFQILPASAWLHPVDTARLAMGGDGVLVTGAATAMVGLSFTLLTVLLLVAVLLGPTLLRAARSPTPPLPGARATIFFAALGAAFMAAELSLVQRMHVVLGHPTYALVIVLGGLLVATGLGSALSPRLLRSRRAVGMACLGAGLLLASLPYVFIGPLARATAGTPFPVRALWCGGVAALVGFVLGMMFPSGLAYVSRERGAPVALAVNGATGVLASVAVTALSIWAGTSASFAAAGALYVLAAAAGPAGWTEAPPPGAS